MLHLQLKILLYPSGLFIVTLSVFMYIFDIWTYGVCARKYKIIIQYLNEKIVHIDSYIDMCTKSNFNIIESHKAGVRIRLRLFCKVWIWIRYVC